MAILFTINAGESVTNTDPDCIDASKSIKLYLLVVGCSIFDVQSDASY